MSTAMSRIESILLDSTRPQLGIPSALRVTGVRPFWAYVGYAAASLVFDPIFQQAVGAYTASI